MLRDIWDFIVSVLSHWQAYASGGFVTALIGIAERLSDFTLPKKAYVAIFVVAYLLVAFFLAWRTEHRQVLETEARETELRDAKRSLEARVTESEVRIRDLTAQLATSRSALYTPSLDLIYAERQFRFFNRGSSNLYLWGTRLGDQKRLIEQEPRLISPAGGALVGQSYYYLLGDTFEKEAKEKLGDNGEARIQLEVFVAAEDQKRYRIRYVLWTIIKDGAVTVRPQNTGFAEIDWTKN